MLSKCAKCSLVARTVPVVRHNYFGIIRQRHMSALTGGAAELRKLSCAGACKGDTPKLSTEDLTEKLKDLPAWELSPDQTTISRKFVAKNFVAALEFFNQVKNVAEAEGHHPDLHLTGYRIVQVDLQTHSIGGVSVPDLIMAAKLDELPVTYSPKWLREHGSNQPQPSK